MSFNIVRNDITEMNTEAIVNTANERPVVGSGCDCAIYTAAGYDQLLAYRQEKIGPRPQGDVFITPGFGLAARYIIHAVSPRYTEDSDENEKLLRGCYRKSLELAKVYGISSIAFPLISTGNFAYPKEEGLRIAADEITAFLMNNDMEITLVVFDDASTDLGYKLDEDLEEYIDVNYIDQLMLEEYVEYDDAPIQMPCKCSSRKKMSGSSRARTSRKQDTMPRCEQLTIEHSYGVITDRKNAIDIDGHFEAPEEVLQIEDYEELEKNLDDRLKHMSDSFSEYLFYLIGIKKLDNATVWKKGLVDKKTFSKIKNNPDYHPSKLTALCLCVGACLNLDETKDLLARAGYALSPSDITDIIFSYFIENQIFDILEIDIQLEAHGVPCIVS